jgi:hypothetical protein
LISLKKEIFSKYNKIKIEFSYIWRISQRNFNNVSIISSIVDSLKW